MVAIVSFYPSSFECERIIPPGHLSRLLHFNLLLCISPYYIWLGRSRSTDVTRFLHAFEIESGNTIGNMTPKSLRAMKAPEDAAVVPELEIGEPALRLESRQEEPEQGIVIDVSPPLSSFHYQVKNVSKPYNYKSTQA